MGKVLGYGMVYKGAKMSGNGTGKHEWRYEAVSHGLA